MESVDFTSDRVTVLGADFALEHLSAIKERMTDMRPIMEGALRAVMTRSAQETFQAQGRPTLWPPLKEPETAMSGMGESSSLTRGLDLGRGHAADVRERNRQVVKTARKAKKTRAATKASLVSAGNLTRGLDLGTGNAADRAAYRAKKLGRVDPYDPKLNPEYDAKGQVPESLRRLRAASIQRTNAGSGGGHKRGTDLILEDTRALLMSLSPGGNEYSVSGADNLSSWIGTTRPGARNHQDGVTLPQRRFLLAMPEDVTDEKAIIVDYVINGFTGGVAA